MRVINCSQFLPLRGKAFWVILKNISVPFCWNKYMSLHCSRTYKLFCDNWQYTFFAIQMFVDCFMHFALSDPIFITAQVYTPRKRKAKRGFECSSHALRLNSSLYKSLKQCACFLMEGFCSVNIEGLLFATHPCSSMPVICLWSRNVYHTLVKQGNLNMS